MIKKIIATTVFLLVNNVNAQTIDNQLLIVPNGLISQKPIISDATFAIIAKKNNLSEKEFTDKDLKKLDEKFLKITNSLKKEDVFEKIKIIAPKYGISPESLAACIIGEHVFNVDLTDQFQNYFISIYSKWVDKHNAIQTVYHQLLKEDDIKIILQNKEISDYEKWDTIMKIYNKKYRGTKDYPNKNFVFTFFNPYGAGLTYGLGQLSPIRILLTNDIAIKMGKMKKIEPTNTEDLYFSTLDVDTNINYVAASVVASITNYKKYAQFDISNNIGVIATLYNLGDEKKRAIDLYEKNQNLRKENKSIIFPVENFYGWYMNKKENEIKVLFHKV